MVAGSTGSGSLGRYANGESLFDFKNRDKHLRLWDVARRRQIERLEAQPIFGDWNGSRMLLMPDFKTLVTTWGAYNIKIIDVRKRRPNRTVDVHNGYISNMALSPDGNVLALGMTAQVQFLDAHTFRLLRTYQHGGQATQVRFGASSGIVKCMWASLKPHYVDVQSAKRLPNPGSTRDYEVWLSPDKKYFVQVKDTNAVELWKQDVGKSHKVKTWQSSLIEIYDVQFAPNGKTLAVAGLSSTETPIQFFDVASAK